MKEIDEQTGGWKLVITREAYQVKVAIQGPRGGEKAFVRISAEALRKAVHEETA